MINVINALSISTGIIIISVIIIDFSFLIFDIDGFDWLKLSKHNNLNQGTLYIIEILGYFLLAVVVLAIITRDIMWNVLVVGGQLMFLCFRFGLIIIEDKADLGGGNDD